MSRPRSAMTALLYFCLLLWTAMPQGWNTTLVHFQEGDLTPHSTNADIIRLFTTADAAFVANKAKTIVDSHDWAHVTGWPLWPPGMIAIETLCYWLSPQLPIALVLIVIGCSLWTATFLQAGQYLEYRGLCRIAAFLLPLLLLLTAEFNYYFHTGIFYSESYTTAPFLLGIGLLLRSRYTRNYRYAVSSGLFLAFSAYMRAQTDLVMTVTCAAFLCSMIWKLITQEKSLRYRAIVSVLHNTTWLAVLGVALASYYVATFPYRAAHHMQWISINESPMWPPTWNYKKDIAPGLEFYITGGGVEGCNVDPVLCEAIHTRHAAGENFSKTDYFHFTLQSFIQHPIRWLEFKAPYLYGFWMENAGESVVFTCLLPALLIICVYSKENSNPLIAIFLFTTSIGIIAPLLLTHFESRYLYQFRMLILYSAIIVTAGSYARPANEKT